MLDNFYIRMAALFGHTFTSQYGTSPNGVAGDTWAAVLAGLSGEQLACGLREVVKLGSDWPPSAPRFRMLCLNIPSLAHVRQEFKSADSKHRSPFARKMWQFIDSYALTRADQDKADRMFRDAYDLTREHVMNGGELPQPPVAVIENEKPAEPVSPSPEKVKQHLAEIERMLKEPVGRPGIFNIERKVDQITQRTFIRATLTDGTCSTAVIETETPTQEQILAAINAEIDLRYPPTTEKEITP